MKPHSSKAAVDTSAHAQANTHDSAPQKSLNLTDSLDWDPEMEENDPVWNLLSQASTPKPDPFFARNVVRSARLLEKPSNTWLARVTSLFTARTSRRLTLGAAACVCALVTYQMWPSPEATEAPETSITATPSPPTPPSMASTELSELVIAETLDAAAEDPTIFTHDEVVAMIGF